MVYTFDSRVRFSETDVDGNLSIAGLINYLQDCSTFQSEDVGVGVEALRKKNQVWMTASWQIVVERLPRFGDHITIGTKAVGFDPVLAQRNFFLLDDKGEMIVKANSYWTMVNIETGRAMHITEDMISMYGLEKPMEMENAPRRIRVPAQGGIVFPAITVTEELLDVNKHVNNGKYIQLAAHVADEYHMTHGEASKEQQTPGGCGVQRRLHQIRAEYKKAAVLGDEMLPCLYLTDSTSIITLKSPAGEVNAIVELLYE